MQPDVTAQSSPDQSFLARLPEAWRWSLATLLAGAVAVMAIAAREWGEMFHQWWDIDTYTHILLVPFIIGWLVSLKLAELAKITPRAWLPGLGLVAAGLLPGLVVRIVSVAAKTEGDGESSVATGAGLGFGG